MTIGCVRTEISPLTTQPEIARLSALASRQVALEVQLSPDLDERVGSQFTFIFLPIGSVYVPSLADAIKTIATEQLALLGVRATPTASTRLRLTVNQLALSGYDLFFIRRISCRLALSAELLNPNGAPRRFWHTSLQRAATRKAAFEPQLRLLFEETLREALQEILSKVL